MELDNDIFYSAENAIKKEKLEMRIEKRAAGMAKRDSKGIPYVVVTDIEYNRIIMHMRGYIRNRVPGKEYELRFVNRPRTRCFYPDHIEINEDGTFYLTQNILCSNNEQPLLSAHYYLVLFEPYEGHREEALHIQTKEDKNMKFGEKVYNVSYNEEGFMESKTYLTTEYPAYIDTNVIRLCDARKDNTWNFKVNKTKRSWMHVYAAENFDDGQFYLNVSYRPHKSYGDLFIVQKAKKAKRKANRRRFIQNCYRFKNDVKTLLIKKSNLFFKKFAKHKGDIILFCSASRAEIGGNEKFIYDRMIERGLDKQFKFRFDFKPSIKTNRPFWKMLKFVYYLATSDVIVLDDYYPIIYDFEYDEDVKVVQVWHACGAFKTIGFERIGHKDAPHFNSNTHKCYTHVIVSSELSAKHNAESFCISESKFYNTGIPRTDLFFDPAYKEEVTQRMFEEFPGCKDRTKVYLYAPTFRGTNANNAKFPFGKIDLDIWGKFLVEENSALIIKMHPFVHEHIYIPEEYRDRIFDATDYREVNDILFISDVLITDYSSVIYEMSLLNRPMLFYAFDRYTYERSRGFYESYEDTVPGKIVMEFDDLMEALKNRDYEFYKMDGFIKKNFTHTDGKSTDRVIDEVFLK